MRDLPAGGRPVLLCWSKRVWRCRHRACATVTFSERTGAIRPKGVLTERARAEACRRVGQDAHSVAQVAADLGVGWPTVMRAVAEFGQRILDAAWVDRAVTRQLAQNTIDAVRRRVQTDTLGHRGRSGDPLYGIRAVLAEVDLPVNVLAVPGTPPVAELAELGVRRVSVGASFTFSAYAALADAATELLTTGTYAYTDNAARGRSLARDAFS